MLSANAPKAKVKAYGLVRDKDGKPKVDNPQDMPPEVFRQLSAEERNYIFGELQQQYEERVNGTNTHNSD